MGGIIHLGAAMAEHTLDLDQFRATFPPFADPALFTDAFIESQWDLATAFMNPWDSCFINGARLQQALNLLTAHLIFLSELINKGAASGGGAQVGPMASASIDKVAVSMVAPPTRNGWQYWLSSSPYGLTLWALLQALAAGGFYFGGSREREGFRKIGGRF